MQFPDGEQPADALLPVVYAELRLLAAAKMALEASGQTLQPTALVHEAWLRLGGDDQPDWQNRAHFFASAAEAMRRILIDRARRRHACRHGGQLARTSSEAIDREGVFPNAKDAELLDIYKALDALERHDHRKAELVKLCFFAGFSFVKAGRALGISEATATRDWSYSRAWLYTEIKRLRGSSPDKSQSAGERCVPMARMLLRIQATSSNTVRSHRVLHRRDVLAPPRTWRHVWTFTPGMEVSTMPFPTRRLTAGAGPTLPARVRGSGR